MRRTRFVIFEIGVVELLLLFQIEFAEIVLKQETTIVVIHMDCFDQILSLVNHRGSSKLLPGPRRRNLSPGFHLTKMSLNLDVTSCIRQQR